MKHKIISAVTLAILLLIFFLLRQETYFWFLIFSIAFIYLAAVVYGSSQIKANYFVNSINRGKLDAVTFTFDDGPDMELTPKILELLEEEKIKATFFVIGKKAEQYPELLQAMSKQGHIIANHSYSHSNFIGLFSSKKLEGDIERCSKIIEKAIGDKPLYFRPPFGVTNPRYSNVLKKIGLISIGWTIRSFDTSVKNNNKLFERITKSITNGSIILFHDTQNITVEVLSDIIKFYRQHNVKIVSLPELINLSPYKNV